jgi:hypothetical protein
MRTGSRLGSLEQESTAKGFRESLSPRNNHPVSWHQSTMTRWGWFEKEPFGSYTEGPVQERDQDTMGKGRTLRKNRLQKMQSQQ